MNPIEAYTGVIEAMKGGGPWIALSSLCVCLYAVSELRNLRLHKKQDVREEAMRNLMITLAGVNAKSEKTLSSMTKVLVADKASSDRCEVRLLAVERELEGCSVRLEHVVTRVAELCGRHNGH